MNKRFLLPVTLAAGIASLIVVTEIFAVTEVKDVIRFENKAYKKHKRPITVFSHRKHQDDYSEKYPEFYASKCGECHHDKDNKKLNDLKEGDFVDNCIECHKKPKFITGKKAKKLTKEQKREYHGNALHDNCKACHKKYNKKYKKKSKSENYAPNTCKTCHPKEKKKK
jgi:cytochrome c553